MPRPKTQKNYGIIEWWFWRCDGFVALTAHAQVLYITLWLRCVEAQDEILHRLNVNRLGAERAIDKRTARKSIGTLCVRGPISDDKPFLVALDNGSYWMPGVRNKHPGLGWKKYPEGYIAGHRKGTVHRPTNQPTKAPPGSKGPGGGDPPTGQADQPAEGSPPPTGEGEALSANTTTKTMPCPRCGKDVSGVLTSPMGYFMGYRLEDGGVGLTCPECGERVFGPGGNGKS